MTTNNDDINAAQVNLQDLCEICSFKNKCKKYKESQKLKDLLKECREEIDKAKNILTEDTNIDNTIIAHATLRKILTKIDEALK